MVMYPEGGIRTPGLPQLADFKNGPFRVAIEQQVPVVPVTIPLNGYILPNDKKLLMKPIRPRMILHEPIPTVGMTEADIEPLKQRVREVIEQELAKHHPSAANRANPMRKKRSKFAFGFKSH